MTYAKANIITKKENFESSEKVESKGVVEYSEYSLACRFENELRKWLPIGIWEAAIAQRQCRAVCLTNAMRTFAERDLSVRLDPNSKFAA